MQQILKPLGTDFTSKSLNAALENLGCVAGIAQWALVVSIHLEMDRRQVYVAQPPIQLQPGTCCE